MVDDSSSLYSHSFDAECLPQHTCYQFVMCVIQAVVVVVVVVFSVSSWDGGESLLDKEHAADRANRLKRCMSDLYDEEIDRGRVGGQ